MASHKTKERFIHQTLIDAFHPPIHVQDEILESTLTEAHFERFFKGHTTHRFVGLGPIYTQRGALWGLALSVTSEVLVVQFQVKKKEATLSPSRELLQDQVLCSPDVTLLGFDMVKLAIALFSDHGLRIANGVDIQSAGGGECREPLAAIKAAVGDRVKVNDDNVSDIFQSFTLGEDKRTTAFVQQAWVAQCLASYEGMEEQFRNAKNINTKDRSDIELNLFTRLERGEQRLELAQPVSTTHEYSAIGARGATAQLQGTRFQNRFQQGGRYQRVMVTDSKSGMTYVDRAEITRVDGRNATLTATSRVENRVITGITTIGPTRPTNADRARSEVVRQAMQNQTDLFVNPFLKYIFNPGDDFAWPESFPSSDHIPDIVTTRPLNDSQRRAVDTMLDNTNKTRLTVIQGPPGTGKTTVIAAYVCSAVAADANGIWLVAQSNIAVKNIGEKLADIGFENWRLLISREFHFSWHEHIYKKLNKKIIRSDEFRQARKNIQGIPVFLCTLSMLSNPRIDIFTNANPIKTLVVDEASQITLGQYVAPLNSFPSITKMCMIGDDKQLPPYGSENDPDNIKSIFEIEHLRPYILFLSIQYRMPPLIGDVVSEVVYEGQLSSNPEHPIPSHEPSCWFVHVEDSQEKPHNTSWHNPTERATVLKIAAKLQEEGKEYCIITPYDAQRSQLENDLKKSGLVWEDKCFNVDSFQGNEKDYIIVSLVRTAGLGFLEDRRRTNVMLTRCKRGMYIVTEWDFIWKRAHETLIGRMAAAWGNDVWVNPEHLKIEASSMDV